MPRRPRYLHLRDPNSQTEDVGADSTPDPAPKKKAAKKKRSSRKKKTDDLPAVEAPRSDASDELERMG